MDILYLLIPLSVVLVLMILAGLWWAVYHGQFESVEQEGSGFSETVDLCQCPKKPNATNSYR